MRALACRCFKYARAQPLTAHLHQAERRNPANLNSCTIVGQCTLHGLFDFTDVGIVLHVDKVDYDETRHVAQPQLSCDFVRGFKIGAYSGRLDPVFARRTARVDVDRHQRFGRVDNQIAARFQLDDRIIHCRELILDMVALKQRHGVDIRLHASGVAGHQQLHELLGVGIALGALDDDLFDVLVIDVADRPLDEIAVLVNQRWRGAPQCVFTDFVPQAGKIVEVAANLDLGPLQAGGAHDATHGLGEVEFGHDDLQPLAVRCIRNLATDSAPVRRIGHQHAISSGKRQIGRQRRAFVATLFFNDLYQQYLPTADDVLNFVTAAQVHPLLAERVGSLFIDPVATGCRGRRRCVLVVVCGIGVRPIMVLTVIVVMTVQIHIVIARAQSFFLGGVFRLFVEQRFAVFFGDLVIIRVDFAEREETVAVTPVVDKRRLQRGFDPRHFGQIDVALELLVFGGFEIKLFDSVTFDDRDPGFFPVARIDQHTHCHLNISGSAAFEGARLMSSDGSWARLRARRRRRVVGVERAFVCLPAIHARSGRPEKRPTAPLGQMAEESVDRNVMHHASVNLIGHATTARPEKERSGKNSECPRSLGLAVSSPDGNKKGGDGSRRICPLQRPTDPVFVDPADSTKFGGRTATLHPTAAIFWQKNCVNHAKLLDQAGCCAAKSRCVRTFADPHGHRDASPGRANSRRR